MPEHRFGREFGLDYFAVDQPSPDDFYLFRDAGSDILAVAHLDTVGLAYERSCRFVSTEGGPVVFSRALDDRLGAYIILDMLPKLGLDFDILLTVGEESGRSTAAYFEQSKQYDWMIEFDRGGSDVVMYQYDDDNVRALVKESGARVGDGIFSDICYLEHLGVKGFNWGVGYQDYHGPRAHAYLDDTCDMVDRFLDFHANNAGVYMPHKDDGRSSWWGGLYGDKDDDAPDEMDPFHWDDEWPSLRRFETVHLPHAEVEQ